MSTLPDAFWKESVFGLRFSTPITRMRKFRVMSQREMHWSVCHARPSKVISYAPKSLVNNKRQQNEQGRIRHLVVVMECWVDQLFRVGRVIYCQGLFCDDSRPFR